MRIPQRLTDEPNPVAPGDAAPGFIPDGGLWIDSSGSVVAMSAGAARMLGRSFASVHEALQDSDDFPRARVVEALQRAKDVWGRTLQLVTMDRQHRHYILVCTEIIKQNGGPERMLAIVTDLSEMIRHCGLEDDVVRQVRHDLCGPLTSLRGAVDLLQTGRLGTLEESQRKLLGLMDRAAQQMADLLATAPGDAPRDPGEAP